MKRILTFIGIAMLSTSIFSQPSWTKKAAQSVFTLKTFATDGTMIGSANGFFISENGECVSAFAPFSGAARAIIIDSKGKEMSVDCILGANETYDVVKFKVEAKRTQPIHISTVPLQTGNEVWLMPYSTGKGKEPVQGEISKTETFQEQYAYYTIKANTENYPAGSLLLDGNGDAVGLLQQSANSKTSACYGVSAEFAYNLKINGLSINDAALKSTSIKKALPEQLDQAILTMYIAGSTLDSAGYTSIVNDFIQKFPSAPDGYVYRAQIASDDNRFADATRDMEQAIKVAEKKDEPHYNYANLIYAKETYKKDIPYEKWSLDKAAEEAEAAYTINPLPTYRQLKAEIRITQKQYNEAYDIYMQLADNGTKTAEIYFAAARCKALLNDTTAMLALMDSTVNTFSRPYLKDAAPYILARAQALNKAGQFRAAVADYNEYERLMTSKLTDSFYYIRAQAEMEGHMYQPAINDMVKAIDMAPTNTLYYAEKASFEIRLGLLDEAIATANRCIELDATQSDGFLFLGLAQCLKGDKANGIKNLQKAGELGDEQAHQLIEQYK